MPIYEYSCPKCGVFEHFHKISEPHLKTCPQCECEVKKLIGRNIGVLFKASGYYVSDNRSQDYLKKAQEDSSSGSSSSAASSTDNKAKSAAE